VNGGYSLCGAVRLSVGCALVAVMFDVRVSGGSCGGTRFGRQFSAGAVLLAAPVWCAGQGVLVAGVARLGFYNLGGFWVMGCMGLPWECWEVIGDMHSILHWCLVRNLLSTQLEQCNYFFGDVWC